MSDSHHALPGCTLLPQPSPAHREIRLKPPRIRLSSRPHHQEEHRHV